MQVWAHEQRVRIPDKRDVVPFVQESVFPHHPDFRCALRESSTISLCGLDGHESTSNLTGISELVPESASRQAIGSNQELILVKLLERIGLVQRREREAGSWVIEDQAVGSGETGRTGWPRTATRLILARNGVHLRPASDRHRPSRSCGRV